MKTSLSRTITVFSLAVLVMSSFLPATNAAAVGNTGGQALEIAPPVVNVSAKPGETVTAQLSLRDVSDGPLIVTSQINDFVAGGEDGTPKILMDQKEDNPYSIKQWIVPLPQLTLQPRQIKKIPVTINVPANAAPGGYYGVVRFTATPPDLEGNGVSLSASLGALVLLKVEGKAKEDMSIASFSTVTKQGGKETSIFESAPVTFSVRLKNDGNVHEQPAGKITVTDTFGKTVGAVNVNMPPRNVLPASIRQFEPSFDKSVLGTKNLFGYYTAKLQVTYGEGKKKYNIEETIHFWVIPYKLIAAIIIGLIVLFFALRTMLRRYNRHIIKQSQRRR